MQAIILAAGSGQRLGEISNGKPKCLLNFDGMSLLHRHCHILANLGVENLLVVTGYQEEEIIAEIKSFKGNLKIRTAFNPEFKSGSVISLNTASEVLEAGDEFILMDADVLYHADILKQLVNSPLMNCLLLDQDFEAGDEPVKICARQGRIVDFRKVIDKQLEFDLQGESVGFFKFSGDIGKALSRRCQYYIEHGKKDEPYEEVLRDLLLAEPESFGFEDITGLAWIEIDFPEDVKRAANEILPTLPGII